MGAKLETSREVSGEPRGKYPRYLLAVSLGTSGGVSSVPS